MCRLDDRRMLRQSEIIIGAKVEYLPILRETYLGSLRRLNGPMIKLRNSLSSRDSYQEKIRRLDGEKGERAVQICVIVRASPQ